MKIAKFPRPASLPCWSRILAALALLLLFCDLSAQTPVLEVVIPPTRENPLDHGTYFPRLLDLALRKTEASHGPYLIRSSPVHSTSKRLITMLKQGQNVNLIWTVTKAEFDQELLRVPVSLLRGLNSHRVFLIRKADRERFATIKDLSQLRELKAGQVQYWADTEILQVNKLPVVTPAHYDLLFEMLAAGRFDYFPRGLYEVWDEYEQHKSKGLVIEETLMLHYPSEMYFFVSPSNRALAERVETGLRLAQEDGSLDTLFFSIPSFRKGYEEMLSPERKLLTLTRLPINAEAGALSENAQVDTWASP